MQILVAGGEGQVGKSLCQMAEERELSLVALSRSELDITDRTSVEEALIKYQPDIVINAAAYTSVEKAEKETDLAYSINEAGTFLLAEICDSASVPMLHLSTDYIFDGTKGGLYIEEDSANPLSVYGKSKYAGEIALQHRAKRHIILRTSWVFSDTAPNFLLTMYGLLQTKKHVDVISDQYGSPTSSIGIANALLTICQKINDVPNPWGVYHFSGSPFTSWYEYSQFIKSCMLDERSVDLEWQLADVRPIATQNYNAKVKRPQCSCLDNSKIKLVFDCDPDDWRYHVRRIIKSLNKKRVGKK